MAKDRLSRKLAVILHADVVGSTKLVQQNETLAHVRIQNAFRRFSDNIEKYEGHVLELRGDALLAKFERPSDAVAATLSFQADHTFQISRLKDDLRPTIRVGIAMGEVVIADNTVTGAGVVLAQRVEQLASPGGLCVTAALHEALPKHMPFDLEDLGEKELKGFDHAVRVYRVELSVDKSIPPPQQNHRIISPKSKWAMGSIIVVALVIAFGVANQFMSAPPKEEPALVERIAFPLPDTPSIAVLPFTNMSGDPEQEYFADGMTEDLITDLSRISGIFVIARHSSFSYKGKQVNVQQVAEDLGVQYVLEGSVRRSGDQVRINAQLIDATTGGHIWAERFDGTMGNVFSLQDHVNRKIVSALKVNLTADDQKRLEKIETYNPDAYDLLLRGLARYQLFSRESSVRAREMFEQAASLDPDYARAYANIALTYATDVNFYWTSNRERSIRLGLEYADKALKLDDSIPQIYMTRSILYLAQRQFQAAIEAALRTIEVHPNYADGYASLAFILSYSGQLERALETIRHTKQINPNGTAIYLGVEGRILFLLGNYQEALVVLQESVERNPAFDRTHLTLAAAYVQLGQVDDANWAVDEALAINSKITLEKESQEALYMREIDLEHYLDALRKAGVPEQ